MVLIAYGRMEAGTIASGTICSKRRLQPAALSFGVQLRLDILIAPTLLSTISSSLYSS